MNAVLSQRTCTKDPNRQIGTPPRPSCGHVPMRALRSWNRPGSTWHKFSSGTKENPKPWHFPVISPAHSLYYYSIAYGAPYSFQNASRARCPCCVLMCAAHVSIARQSSLRLPYFLTSSCGGRWCPPGESAGCEHVLRRAGTVGAPSWWWGRRRRRQRKHRLPTAEQSCCREGWPDASKPRQRSCLVPVGSWSLW